MRRGNKDKAKKEFDELLLEVKRVTRVTTGGRRMSFRATVLVGNRKGKIWLGVAKGPDVSIAVQKASREAYKNIFVVPLSKAFTVPYPTTTKYKACVIKLLPAVWGTGLKAGSSIRSVLELAGYENILSKMIGSNNKLNNALATISALTQYKHADHFSKTCEAKKEVVEDKTDDRHDRKRRPAPRPQKAVKKDEKVEEKKVEAKPEIKEEKKVEVKPEVKEEKKVEKVEAKEEKKEEK